MSTNTTQKHTVKRGFSFLFILCLSLFSLCAFAQDKRVYTTHDPTFDYIEKYMPEYYYENFKLESDHKNISYDRLKVDVRVLHNFKDEKTFTYLIIRNGKKGEYTTLFTDEIPSLISYLERIICLMKKGKKEKSKDSNFYIYNSLTGLFFKAERKQTSFGWPFFDLDLYFPKIEKVEFSGEDEIEHFIYKLKSAEQYFPPKETDFLIDEDERGNKWEMKELQEPEQELKTT